MLLFFGKLFESTVDAGVRLDVFQTFQNFVRETNVHDWQIQCHDCNDEHTKECERRHIYHGTLHLNSEMQFGSNLVLGAAGYYSPGFFSAAVFVMPDVLRL